MHFLLFGCIRGCFVASRNSMQNSAEQVQKFVPRSFGAFCTIWVHSGLFGCLTKLGAKRAKQVQKFVPRSRVRIFRKERTRSTPLDSELTFWCVSYYLGAFGTVSLPYQTPCKTGRSGAKVCAMKSCRNFLIRTLPIHPIGP